MRLFKTPSDMGTGVGLAIGQHRFIFMIWDYDGKWFEYVSNLKYPKPKRGDTMITVKFCWIHLMYFYLETPGQASRITI